MDSPEEAARRMSRQRRLGLPGGILFCNPPPAESALDSAEVESLVSSAVLAAEEKSLRGKEVTPFLLDHLAEASAGRTLAVNLTLLEDNARVAARIAVAYASSMD